jgi:hypothetical protein
MWRWAHSVPDTPQRLQFTAILDRRPFWYTDGMSKPTKPGVSSKRLNLSYHAAVLVAAGVLAWAFLSQFSPGLGLIQGVTGQSTQNLSRDHAELRLNLPSLLPTREDWSDGR